MNEECPQIINIPKGKKRVVVFGRKAERDSSPVEFLSYYQYIKKMAEKMGYDEKGCRFVNRQTRKVSDGHLCEEAILGRCTVSRNEKIPVPRGISRSRELERARGVLFDFFKEKQPSEKSENEGIKESVEKLLLDSIKDVEINFYTAIGSPLDYQYGIDGWIEVVDINTSKKEIITFDLKTGGYKNNNIQADLVLESSVDGDNFNVKDVLKDLLRFKDEVISIYNERINANT